MNKEAEIVRLLRSYISAFPRADMKDTAFVIYARALSVLSVEEVNAAMLKLLRTAKFWPTVAEIFEAAKSVRESATGEAMPTAAEAWGEVQELAKRLFLDKPWTFSHDAIRKTVELFGKRELCIYDEDSTGIVRGQFIRMYNEVARKMQEERENEAVLAVLPKARERISGKVMQIDMGDEK